MFDKDVLAMSLAPKDEHEAQIQFALERGIPAFSSVMGTQRLVFPSNVYDVVHCARCRVPWEIEGESIPVPSLFCLVMRSSSSYCCNETLNIQLRSFSFAYLLFTQLSFTTSTSLKEFYDFGRSCSLLSD